MAFTSAQPIDLLSDAARRGSDMTAATHGELVTLLAEHSDAAEAATALLTAYPQLGIDFAIEHRAAATTSATDSLAVPASHAQWDLGARGLASVVRVSPHVYTDESDVEALLTAVAGVTS